MEIRNEITKAVFERHVPSAKMPERNDSVYTRLEQEFATTYDQLLRDCVGRDFESKVESDAHLKNYVLRFVCQQAFCRTIRSLDLVLTATGFGIVSTTTLAPASKVRVDALLDDMRLQSLQSLHEIVKTMTAVEGWGSTMAARKCIDCLFWHIDYVRQYTVLRSTADNWQQAHGLAVVCDAFLRRVISNEYMDELLDKIRTNSTNTADGIILGKCMRVIGSFIDNYETVKTPDKYQLDALRNQLEHYISSYPTYQQSEVYRGLHAERYQNKKEDPTFFFM